MAKKEALKQLQTRLAERLLAAKTQARTVSWLAVESGGLGLLFPLAEAGEIFSLGPLLQVPHAQPWFLGVANLRGQLTGVVDLAVFLGARMPIVPGQIQEGLREPSRLIAFNANLETNCAVLVDRLAGLRSEEQLQKLPDDEAVRSGFVRARYQDGTGRQWLEMSLAHLSVHETFLRIGTEPRETQEPRGLIGAAAMAAA